MDNFSDTKAYILSALNGLQNDADIEDITNFLIGFHIDHPAKNSKLFDKFIVKNFTVDSSNLKLLSGNPTGVIPAQAGIQKKVVLFHQVTMDPRLRGDDTERIKLNRLCLRDTEKDKVKHSKYEVRFFWPAHLYPEVYDFSGVIFNESDYKYKLTKDKYIIAGDNINIKIRKNELHIKNYLQQVGTIYQFKKKKKISFPVKGDTIKELLNKKINFTSEVFETPENLILELSNIPGIFCVDITKERYVRKMEDRTKIELSLITIKEKQWKTICIESTNIQKVLALSLLINQDGAERLSYDEFLRKYG